ncbi:MAG: ATP-binding cassette domain-containing protein [Gammaproteobacteria bacterium]|nr:ATP-binding cassette domain-containing protein [Gammaproteobacteria bacterium]
MGDVTAEAAIGRAAADARAEAAGAAVRASGLHKRFGALTAVEGLDLEIPTGRFFGLLGPNGSGKTTTIHMLSTLIRPTAGRAWVAGRDVLSEPVTVRRAIGLVFQESALDRSLTVEENLTFTAALHDVAPRVARPRIGELLELFGLTDKRHVIVGRLSGGMRRALDIVRGVLHRPRILFLDEPTIGLDVINRRAIWRYIDRLRDHEGMTVLLTTHYLEEAEDCHQVVFLNQGRLIGAGSPREMVDGLGAYILEVEGAESALVGAELRARLGEPLEEGEKLVFRIPDEDFPLAALQDQLRARVKGSHVRRPDLNDVYLWLNSAGSGGDR